MKIEGINDNLHDAFEPAGQLDVEKEPDEESVHETTQGKRRRLDFRWLKVTQF